MQSFRFYVRSPDGRAIYGFDRMEGAETAALEYGDGAFIVDTGALTYEPMVQMVKDGQVIYFGVSGWNTNKLNDSDNLIEGIRNGHVAIAHAYIARGADVNYRDKLGGTPLHWAAARGKTDIAELLLAHGANPAAEDSDGETPLDVAKARKKIDLVGLLSKVSTEA
jgi:ankyrin repeat protein